MKDDAPASESAEATTTAAAALPSKQPVVATTAKQPVVADAVKQPVIVATAIESPVTEKN